jgi:uncharacterized membrane protein
MRNRRVIPMVLWIMFVTCSAVPRLAAAGQSGGKAGDAAQIEEVQEVSAVESPARPSAAGLLGRFHPALVHFPIAWVFLLQLVEITALITRREEWRKMGLFVLILACLSFVPAAATGFLRAASVSSDPEFRALMLTHRNLNIAAALVCMGALALRLGFPRQFESRLHWLYLLLLSVCVILLFIAGHLGGKMVFGQG